MLSFFVFVFLFFTHQIFFFFTALILKIELRQLKTADNHEHIGNSSLAALVVLN